VPPREPQRCAAAPLCSTPLDERQTSGRSHGTRFASTTPAFDLVERVPKVRLQQDHPCIGGKASDACDLAADRHAISWAIKDAGLRTLKMA
jgi:hypothetical protein